MSLPPIPDYHMHTPRCNHATGTIAEYAETALSLGMHEIGISDHSPMPEDFDPAWRMEIHELKEYIADVRQAQEQFEGRLVLRLGLEADYHPDHEAFVREMIDAHPWDYVIGSVHFIGDWAFDNPDVLDSWQERDIEQAYCDYFDMVRRSAESGLFDIIGHPDLIKKFGHRTPLDSLRLSQAIDAMLAAVKEADVALEISSAGLRKPVGEVYPHAEIVRRAAALDIPFAFGSDAHAPGEVGHGMKACTDLLLACGIREVAGFTCRKRRMIAIDDA